jgi:hypothetical protein
MRSFRARDGQGSRSARVAFTSSCRRSRNGWGREPACLPRFDRTLPVGASARSLNSGVNAASGLIHKLVVHSRQPQRRPQASQLTHDEEADAFAGARYPGVVKCRENRDNEVRWHVAMSPGKAPALGKTSAQWVRCSTKSSILKVSARAKVVEHPFRAIKRQFGHVKVHNKGLAKNTAQLHTLVAADSHGRTGSEKTHSRWTCNRSKAAKRCCSFTCWQSALQAVLPPTFLGPHLWWPPTRRFQGLRSKFVDSDEGAAAPSPYDERAHGGLGDKLMIDICSRLATPCVVRRNSQSRRLSIEWSRGIC